MIIRLLAVANPHLMGVADAHDRVHDPKAFGDALAEVLNNSPAFAGIAQKIDILDDRIRHVLDVALDVKIEQETVAQILTAAGENRITLVEALMRDSTPDWDALHEDSQRELIAGELEYRAYLAGEREAVHPAAVANLFYRAIEREINQIPGIDPPNWKVFKDERGYADHADKFGEIDLTRMRSYLFGMYRHKPSLLSAIAAAAMRRARRR
jgi:hypothetical protein